MEVPIEQIDPTKWYKPSEVASLGLIENSKGVRDKQYVRILIRRGLLAWRNYAMGEKGRNYYLIQGSEIIKFRNERDQVHKF